MSLGSGDGRQELQQLSQELQAIEAEISSLQAQIDEYRQEQRDIDDAIEAIDSLDTGSQVQVPLGGGAYVSAEVTDIDEIIVSLGDDYAAQQDEEDAVEALERKRDAIDDRIDETRSEKSDLEAEREELEGHAQQMQQQMQQQQAQQLQQLGEEQGGDEDE